MAVGQFAQEWTSPGARHLSTEPPEERCEFTRGAEGCPHSGGSSWGHLIDYSMIDAPPRNHASAYGDAVLADVHHLLRK